uniref:Uncharacterized protein n=1 Tax=Rhizophora mucronata TaxID=61149 RepID=A0A2P2QN53_RHIMU
MSELLALCYMRRIVWIISTEILDYLNKSVDGFSSKFVLTVESSVGRDVCYQ